MSHLMHLSAVFFTILSHCIFMSSIIPQECGKSVFLTIKLSFMNFTLSVIIFYCCDFFHIFILYISFACMNLEFEIQNVIAIVNPIIGSDECVSASSFH